MNPVLPWLTWGQNWRQGGEQPTWQGDDLSPIILSYRVTWLTPHVAREVGRLCDRIVEITKTLFLTYRVHLRGNRRPTWLPTLAVIVFRISLNACHWLLLCHWTSAITSAVCRHYLLLRRSRSRHHRRQLRRVNRPSPETCRALTSLVRNRIRCRAMPQDWF